MMIFERIFGGKRERLERDFRRTFSDKIKVGDRVRNRKTSQLGTVIQTGEVNGAFRVPALSVSHDDGSEAWLVPAEDYTKVGEPR